MKWFIVPILIKIDDEHEDCLGDELEMTVDHIHTDSFRDFGLNAVSITIMPTMDLQ